MAFTHSPKIVTDGLVLLLDATNPKSYVSGSNTWYDISGNNKHFSLGTGIRYSPLYNGELQFPGSTGTNMVSSSVAVTNATACTVQIWSRTIDTDGVYLISIPEGSYYVGAWAEGGFYYNNNSAGGSFRLNGVATNSTANTLNNQYFLFQDSNVNFSSWTAFLIGAYPGISAFSGSIAQVAIYNRNLTTQESIQNFNAFRGRYGI